MSVSDASAAGTGDDWDDTDKDDVIVTLAIPGHKEDFVCCDAIVIPSDSDDGDSEVTIISELSPVAASSSSAVSGTNLCDATAAGDQSDDDDCFVSDVQLPSKLPATSLVTGVDGVTSDDSKNAESSLFSVPAFDRLYTESKSSAVQDRSAESCAREWTIQSRGECKVLLRRSISSDADIMQPPPCKKTKCSSLSADDSTSSLLLCDADVTVQPQLSMCYGCHGSVPVYQLSFCMAGHGCCGQCLQEQVKTLLSSGKKGSLKCQHTACLSFYLVSQLRNSLPAMVVEILEEKSDREYCDNAAKMMLSAVGKDLGLVSDDDCDTETLVPSDTSLSQHADKPDSSIIDFPKTWEPMGADEKYRLVELVQDDEYRWVAALFHQSMTRPRATITRILRLQNHVLWQFYMLKKKQMEHDSSRAVVEKNLFHGTRNNVAEAICQYNFDWRLSGTHGTNYGHGSYFARDASYSHMYTDQPRSSSSQHTSAAMLGLFRSSSHQSQFANSASQSSFPAGSNAAVDLVALRSCRFALLQGAVNRMSSMPVAASAVPSYIPSAHAHIHTMFLARVLVGDYAAGKSGYRKPPPCDPAQPYGRCYDSCVNDVSNPSIFVIFQNSQCYPEYMIEYMNKPRYTEL